MLGVTTTRSRQASSTDAFSFAAAGLPGVNALQDPIEYQSYTWHTNLDTYERVVEEDVKKSAIVIAAAVYHVAMRDEMLPRFMSEQMPRRPERRRRSRRPHRQLDDRATAGEELRHQFGDIDVYLFDQFCAAASIRGTACSMPAAVTAATSLSVRRGFECYGVDNEPSAIDVVRQTAARLAPHLPQTNFAVADLTNLPHPDGRMHAVICSAVLHFADDEAHFTPW